MTRKELKCKSREQLKHNLGLLFICTIIVYAISLAISLLSKESPVIGLIATLIITSPLSLGLVMVYLDAASGNKPQIATLFLGFRQFGQALSTFFLYFFIGMLYYLIISIPIGFTLTSAFYGNSLAPLFICLILLLALTVYLFLPFTWIFYVMAEHPQFSAIEVLKESSRIMKGHRWEYILLKLSFLPWLLPIGIIMTLSFYLLLLLLYPLYLSSISLPIVFNPTVVSAIFVLTIIAVVFSAVYLTPYMTLADTHFYYKIKGLGEQEELAGQEMGLSQNETPYSSYQAENSYRNSGSSDNGAVAEPGAGTSEAVSEASVSKESASSVIVESVNKESASSVIDEAASKDTVTSISKESVNESSAAKNDAAVAASAESPSDDSAQEEEEEWSWDNL